MSPFTYFFFFPLFHILLQDDLSKLDWWFLSSWSPERWSSGEEQQDMLCPGHIRKWQAESSSAQQLVSSTKPDSAIQGWPRGIVQPYKVEEVCVFWDQCGKLRRKLITAVLESRLNCKERNKPLLASLPVCTGAYVKKDTALSTGKSSSCSSTRVIPNIW